MGGKARVGAISIFVKKGYAFFDKLKRRPAGTALLLRGIYAVFPRKSTLATTRTV